MHRKSPYTPCDAEFTVKIDAWQPMPRGFIDVFGRDAFKRLNDRERSFCAASRKIVALTFENRFAQLGGLAAVMRRLPEYLRKAGEDVILLTPLYVNIPGVKEALSGGLLELVVPKKRFKSPLYKGTLSCYCDTGASVPAYFIGVSGRFTAEFNPYSYADTDDLLSDALAFCAAVPFVLNKLGIKENIVFHAHDWETALVALTSKQAVLDSVLESARTVLTLHNSFDSGVSGVSGSLSGDTVLQCAIPLLNGPLTTVSTPFAGEMRSDALQRTVFTNHLQDAFSLNPPVGIENGMFGRPYLQYTYSALSRARQGSFTALLAQKARFREKMLEVAGTVGGHSDVIGVLKGITDETPVFFMSGRLDLMQKGFDVIFRAIQKFPAGGVKLIFCPSSAEGAKHAKELAFFRGIADERRGDVVVWPFRITATDYGSILRGSSFLLMPSFYKPFGAATEGFMHGTPVVARATGGLQVQVSPGDVHGGATGILYREEGGGGGDWKKILAMSIPDRIKVPLYRSMVKEAFEALSAAAAVFADPETYGGMIINGIDSLKSFSWNTAVEKYRRVYDTASRRGFFDD